MCSLRKLLVIACLASTLPACTSFNPYQQSRRIASDLAHPDADKLPALAGGLSSAMGDVNHQRAKWFAALGSQSRARATTAAALIGLGTAGIVGGLRAGVASEPVRRNLALAGGLSAGAYSSFNFFTNEAHEKAYLDGFSRLTCSIAEMRPVMIKETQFQKEIPDEISKLNAAYTTLDEEIAQFNAQYPVDRHAKTPAGRTLDAALDAAYVGRGTQRGTSAWLNNVESAGFMLRREAELIVARTSILIQANQNKIDPKALVGDISSITKAYRDIKIETEDVKGSTPTKSSPADDAAKQPAPPAATASSVKPTSSASTGTPSDTAAKASTPVKDADTATLLEAALKRLQTENTASVAAAKASAKEAATAASEAKLFANQSAGYCTGIDAAGNGCSDRLQASLTKLATATSELYAARRPLSNRLANFNAMRKAVRELPGCGGNSLMSLSPNGDATIESGKPYEISIHNPEGMPALNVTGPAKGEIVLHGSLFVARITPTGSGIIKVTVTDTKGGSDEVDLTVK